MCTPRQQNVVPGKKVVRVAFLGPKGSYSHQAARKAATEQLDASYQLVPCETIGDCFEALVSGKADRSIVPISNSSNGRVLETSKQLSQHKESVNIISTFEIPVQHALLGPKSISSSSFSSTSSSCHSSLSPSPSPLSSNDGYPYSEQDRHHPSHHHNHDSTTTYDNNNNPDDHSTMTNNSTTATTATQQQHCYPIPKYLASHEQALGQCKKFISKHFPPPATQIKQVQSTSHAAEMALRDVNGDTYAIASTLCAELYDLDILETDIQDAKDNATTFVTLVSYDHNSS